MEQPRFFALARRIGSRRAALTGLTAVAAAVAGSGPEAGALRKNKKVCKARYKKCGKRCIDPFNDPAHCGSCKNRCDAGVDCVMGVCGGTA
ncbi:MAG: hypothetical protein QM692_10640 [Thermomicrobiales bacterium]